MRKEIVLDRIRKQPGDWSEVWVGVNASWYGPTGSNMSWGRGTLRLPNDNYEVIIRKKGKKK